MKSRHLKLGIPIILLVVLATLAFVLRREIFPESSPAQRGARVAVKAGCFTCHSPLPGPSRLNPSIGSTSDDFSRVPSLFSERHSPQELREWIETGLSAKASRSQAHKAKIEKQALRMPAFADHLSTQEIDDLIAFISLQQYRFDDEHDRTPVEVLARDFGCFSCHGELGQGGVSNPRSLKGYVPGFFGDDFLALTGEGDPDQVLEWIRDGVSQEFLDQGWAGFSPGRFFADRQALKMPAYGKHLKAEDLRLLTEFVLELHRRGPMDAASLWEFRPQDESDDAETAGTNGFSDPSEAAALNRLAGTGGHDASGEFALFFQVRPLLRRCLNCHGPSEQKSEYRMDQREGLIKGGEIAEFTGLPPVVPGDAQASRILTALTIDEADYELEIYPMPPKGKRLTAAEIELVRRWIEQGLKWPPGADLLPEPPRE